MCDYKVLTVKDIVDFVRSNKKRFPKGLHTPVVSGDFECNNTHGKHEIQYMEPDGVIKENSVCLGYEMHENIYEW